MTEQPIRILYIDLSSQSFEVKVHEDLSSWLGGVGVGTALLSENLDKKPFVMARGPFCGVFPGCSQTFASFISPLSRNLGESHVGGDLGLNLSRAGLEGIVVLGKSKKPIVLEIKNEEVEFVSAEDFWARSPAQTAKELLAVWDSEEASVLTIGPAAEKGVRFSNVYVDGEHYLDMGLGTVWGKAKLKGMVILGDREVLKSSSEEFKKLRRDLEEKLSDPSPEGLKFKIRERQNVIWELLEKSRAVIGENFRKQVSLSPSFAREFFDAAGVRSCSACPLECSPYSCGVLVSLGPLLGLEKKEEILSLLTLAHDLGIDPVSLGFSLAWLTEKEGWEFGDFESYKSLTLALSEREEDWAKKLSLGLLSAASGKERNSALVFSGTLGLPFFCGYLSILSRALSPGILGVEACLLDFSFLEKEVSDEEKVRALISEEERMLLLFSLSGCPLLSKVYDLPTTFSGLESLGMDWSHERLENFSRAVYNLRWEIKERLGFSWDEIEFPERVFEVRSATGRLEKEKLMKMVGMYKENVKTQNAKLKPTTKI